jgi:hypothetical protein
MPRRVLRAVIARGLNSRSSPTWHDPRRTIGRLAQALFIASLLLCALPRVGLAQDQPTDSPPPTQQSGDSSSGTSGPTCNCSRPAGIDPKVLDCFSKLEAFNDTVSEAWGNSGSGTIIGFIIFGGELISANDRFKEAKAACQAAGLDFDGNKPLFCDALNNKIAACRTRCSDEDNRNAGPHDYCMACSYLEAEAVQISCSTAPPAIPSASVALIELLLTPLISSKSVMPCGGALAQYQKYCNPTVDQFTVELFAMARANDPYWLIHLCENASHQIMKTCPTALWPPGVTYPTITLPSSSDGEKPRDMPASLSKDTTKSKSTTRTKSRAKKTTVKTGTAGTKRSFNADKARRIEGDADFISSSNRHRSKSISSHTQSNQTKALSLGVKQSDTPSSARRNLNQKHSLAPNVVKQQDARSSARSNLNQQHLMAPNTMHTISPDQRPR